MITHGIVTEGQHSSTFQVQLLRAKVACAVFCPYILGLYFIDARILAHKLRIEC